MIRTLSHISIDRFQQKSFCGALPGEHAIEGRDPSLSHVLAKPGERPSCPTCADKANQLRAMRAE
jgi:hypothetical protein